MHCSLIFTWQKFTFLVVPGPYELRVKVMFLLPRKLKRVPLGDCEAYQHPDLPLILEKQDGDYYINTSHYTVCSDQHYILQIGNNYYRLFPGGAVEIEP